MSRSPRDKTLALLWARAKRADSTFQHRLQRIAGHPVGNDRFAVAGAAENDATLEVAAADRFGNGPDKQRIVDGRRRNACRNPSRRALELRDAL